MQADRVKAVCRWTRSPGRATPRVQDCSRRPNHQGIPATASSAGDPPLEQNPSSAPRDHGIDGVFTQSGPISEVASLSQPDQALLPLKGADVPPIPTAREMAACIGLRAIKPLS